MEPLGHCASKLAEEQRLCKIVPFCPDHHLYPITCDRSCLFLALLVRFHFVVIVVVVVVVLVVLVLVLVLVVVDKREVDSIKNNLQLVFLV